MEEAAQDEEQEEQERGRMWEEASAIGGSSATTLVTGFWDPGLMQVKKRSAETYWPWIDNLWTVSAPVVFYCSASMIPRLLAMGDWSAGPRCIKIVEFPEFSVFTLKEELKDMVDKDIEAALYSWEYSMIMHEKVQLLATAALQNPFASQHFLWVDAGIDRAGFLRGRSWPKKIALPPALEDKLLVLDVFGSVTQYLERTGREERAGREGEHDATLSIQTAQDLSLPPAQGLMGGIFGGSKRAIARLHAAYYPLLRSCLAHRAQCLTENVLLSALACCSQEASLFFLVAPYWETTGCFYFFFLPYLAGLLPSTEGPRGSKGDGEGWVKDSHNASSSEEHYPQNHKSPPDLPRITSVWSKRCIFPNVAGVHAPGVRYFGNSGGLPSVRRWQPRWTSDVLNVSDLCRASPLSDVLHIFDTRLFPHSADAYNLVARICALKAMLQEGLKTHSPRMYVDAAFLPMTSGLSEIVKSEPHRIKVLDCSKLPHGFSSPLFDEAPCDPLRIVYLPPFLPATWLDAYEAEIGKFLVSPSALNFKELWNASRYHLLGDVEWMDLTELRMRGLVSHKLLSEDAACSTIGINRQNVHVPDSADATPPRQMLSHRVIVSIWSSECTYPVFDAKVLWLPSLWNVHLVCANDKCVSSADGRQAGAWQAERLSFEKLCGTTELYFLAEPTAQIRLKLIFGSYFREVFDLILRMCAMSSRHIHPSTWFVDPFYLALLQHVHTQLPPASSESEKLRMLNCSSMLSTVKVERNGPACDSLRVVFALEHSHPRINALQTRMRRKLEGNLDTLARLAVHPGSASLIVESLLSSVIDMSEVAWINMEHLQVQENLDSQMPYFQTKMSCDNVAKYAVVHPILHCSRSREATHVVWEDTAGLPPGEMTAVRARNVGDSVQSLAAVRFLPAVDVIMDRLIWGRMPSGEFLPGFAGEDVLTIMNGFYGDLTSLGAVWPPPAYVKPVLVGVHLAPAFERQWRASLDWLRKHGVVGCRDPATVNFLKDLGVEAVNTGCPTLSLKRVLPHQKRSDTIWVVDPSSLQDLPELFNFSTRTHVSKEYCEEFLMQEFADYRTAWTAGQQREMIKVLAFVEQYSDAKLLITSRLHAALPALARGTPVVFVRDSGSTVTNKSAITLLDHDLTNPGCRARLSGVEDMFYKPDDLRPNGRLRHVINGDPSPSGLNDQPPSELFIQKEQEREAMVSALLAEQIDIFFKFEGLGQYMKSMDTAKHLLGSLQEGLEGNGDDKQSQPVRNPEAQKPRIAVVLRGVAAASYRHYSYGRITVDWRETAGDLLENVIHALDADVFFHAWRGEGDEYLETEHELNAFFRPVRSRVEPLRSWHWRFSWLLKKDNIDSNYSRNFSAEEWQAHGYTTDSVKFDFGSRYWCDAGYKWTGTKCESFLHGRVPCDQSNVRHFCNDEKLNSMHSFYYSWQESVQLMRDYEVENGFRYDLVLVGRFDMLYTARLDAAKALTALAHGTQLFREPVSTIAPAQKGYQEGFWGGGDIGEGPKVRERWFDMVMAGSSDAVYKCAYGFEYLMHSHRLFTYDSLDSHLTAAYTAAAQGIVCLQDSALPCGSLRHFFPELPLGLAGDFVRQKSSE